ncbi:hypothetical protein [Streptomyces sp. NPDC001404]|uniref:hypothetical protein n=1 Tax=Streptomyces sp. NPDC001404 TaxID=3364571 RepID=UPI00369D9FFA
MMLHRLRTALQELARRWMPYPRPVTAHIALTAATTYDSRSVLSWDGSYLGEVRSAEVALAGTPAQLLRLADEMRMAAVLAEAAHAIDAARPGTLQVNGGEA